MTSCVTEFVSRVVNQCAPLWFEDGDIVIKARDSDSGKICVHKLHRAVLSLRAPVFVKSLDDFFARESSFIEGTPAVFTTEPSQDLEWFMHALYHPSSLLRWKYKSGCFKNALPLYEIALKFKVTEITDILSTQLEQDWPKNIWEWDAFESDDALYMRWRIGIYLDMYAEPAAAIAFARLANLPGILPAAFYQLSRASTDDVFERSAKGEGPMRVRRGSARWSDLSKEDLLTLVAGKDQLVGCMRDIQRGLTAVIPAEEKKCREAWTLMPVLTSDDILHDLKEICKPDRLPGAYMCKGCRSKVNEKARKMREGVWECLPLLFRLPGEGMMDLNSS